MLKTTTTLNLILGSCMLLSACGERPAPTEETPAAVAPEPVAAPAPARVRAGSASDRNHR